MKRILNQSILTAFLLLFLTACGDKPWENYVAPRFIPIEEIPEDTDEPEPPAANAVRIKVMSMAIFRTNSALPAFAEMIKEENPDFVLIREVDKNNTRSGIDVDQAKILADETGMYQVFAKQLNYASGEFGFAVMSRYPIIESSTAAIPTSRAVGMITVEKDGKKFVFVGAQLDDTANGVAARASQAPLLYDYVKDVEGPMILAGSFYIQNVATDPTLTVLKQQFTSGCTDCAFNFTKANPTVIGDHIMYKPKAPTDEVKVVSYKVLPTAPVDRLPVVAEFDFIL